MGAGAATRIVNANTEGKPALIIQPANHKENPKARLWRVQLADFRINGDPKTIEGKSTKPSSGDGVLAVNIDDIYLHGMSIDHNGGHGVNLINCLEDPRVCNSILTYNAKAGLNIVANHDIVVSGNHFEENQDAVRCIDSFNLCMNGNNVDDHLGNGVVIENTYGSVVSGNMIEECQGIALIMDRDCYGITVSANVIAHHNGGGIDLRDAWGCAVSANTFTMCANFGLRVAADSGRITIGANNFSNAYIGNRYKRDDPAAGVVLEGTVDNTLTGNIFTGMQAEAIKADSRCSRLTIVGNVANDLGRHCDKPVKAIDLGGATRCVVANNILPEPTAP